MMTVAATRRYWFPGLPRWPDGGRLLRNLTAMGLSQLAVRASRLVTVLVLTRQLRPADLGAAAIVLTVYELLAVFTRNGIAAKVVQTPDADLQAVARTAHWMIWVVCLALLAIQVVIAMPVALLFHDPSLALPIALMGLIYLATPLCALQTAMLQREGRLGRIALVGGAQVVTDNLLSAALALAGLGLWAIVLPKLLVAPLWVLNRWAHPWRCQGPVTFRGWQAIARFSRGVVGVEMLGTLQANIDTVLVGVLLGVDAVGLYYFAFNAGLGITLGFVNAFAAAVYPHLCAARGDQGALAARFRQAKLLLACTMVPLVLAQVALAPLYVPLLYGEAWRAAIPVMMIICLSALPRPFTSATSQMLAALGRTGTDFAWQAVMTVVLIASLLVGAQQGIIGVAVAILFTQVVVGGTFCLVARAHVPRRS